MGGSEQGYGEGKVDGFVQEIEVIPFNFNTARRHVGINGILGALLHLLSEITPIQTVPVTQTTLSRGMSLSTSSTRRESRFGGQPSLSQGKRV